MGTLPSDQSNPDQESHQRATAPLQVRAFRSYWIGQSVSATGAWMQQVSIPWLLLELGGGPIQLGMFAALYFGPAFVLAPFGGVLADRVSKRDALLIANGSLVAQAAALTLVTATGNATIPIVLGLTAWQGVTNAVEMPFRHSLIAELVPRGMLSSAIALSVLGFNVARILGPAIAGVILGIGSALAGGSQEAVAIVLALNTLSSTAVVGALWAIPASEDAASARTASQGRRSDFMASMREGLAFAAHTPLVALPLALLAGLATFGYNFQTLLPVFGRDVLEVGGGGYGGMFAALGLGGVAGAAAIAVLDRRRAIATLMLSGAIFSMALTALAFVETYLLAIAFLLVVGGAWMAVVSGINTTIQANVPDGLRGRVMSLYVTVFVGGAPIGGLLAGVVAATFGASFALAASGCLSAVVLAAFGLAIRGSATRQSI